MSIGMLSTKGSIIFATLALVLIGLIGLLVWVPGAYAYGPRDPVTFAVSPQSVTVQSGKNITVEITASNADYMAAVTLQLKFDPKVVQVNSVECAVPSEHLICATNADNTYGAIKVSALTTNDLLFGPEVTIARLTMTVVGKPGQSSTLALDDPSALPVVKNEDADPLPFAVKNGNVSVSILCLYDSNHNGKIEFKELQKAQRGSRNGIISVTQRKEIANAYRLGTRFFCDK